MRNRVIVSLVLAICLILATVGCQKTPAAPGAPAEAPKQPARSIFVSGSTPVGTTWYMYVSNVAAQISKKVEGVEIAVRETAGTRENTLRIQKGDLDFGVTETLVAYEAYRGIDRFKDSPCPDIRILWLISPTAMHWMVRQDSNITSLYELTGKSFNPSTIGGGGEYITQIVFDLLGIKPEYYRAHIRDAIEAVKDGRIVGYSYNALPPDAIVMEVHATTPLRLLGLSPEDLKKVREAYPFFAPITIPANTYPGVPEVTTVSLYLAFAAHRNIPEDVIYDVVKAYWETLPEVAKVVPQVANSEPRWTTDYATSPLHPGAIRYYRELGLQVPDEMVPPEMKSR